MARTFEERVERLTEWLNSIGPGDGSYDEVEELFDAEKPDFDEIRRAIARETLVQVLHILQSDDLKNESGMIVDRCTFADTR